MGDCKTCVWRREDVCRMWDALLEPTADPGVADLEAWVEEVRQGAGWGADAVPLGDVVRPCPMFLGEDVTARVTVTV